uniref:NADH-ubiquinone oxidoreductase chain 3 n=1 Tax=Heptamelus sp. TaxID=2821555 RepID=A0A8A6C3S3_9HYME|nr:NADH dehydrogenase subunit 3 [Heptamelus sp.]
MKMMFITMTFLWMLSTIIMILSSIMSKKTLYDREKNSPFECGFDPKNDSRMSFSIQFFLIAVIFLIFDVEISLMFPIIMIFSISHLKFWMTLSTYFILILLMGTYYEWKFGALNWLN